MHGSNVASYAKFLRLFYAFYVAFLFFSFSVVVSIFCLIYGPRYLKQEVQLPQRKSAAAISNSYHSHQMRIYSLSIGNQLAPSHMTLSHFVA